MSTNGEEKRTKDDIGAGCEGDLAGTYVTALIARVD